MRDENIKQYQIKWDTKGKYEIVTLCTEDRFYNTITSTVFYFYRNLKWLVIGVKGNSLNQKLKTNGAVIVATKLTGRNVAMYMRKMFLREFIKWIKITTSTMPWKAKDHDYFIALHR